MIDTERAREIAVAFLGRPSSDPIRPWSLIEFPQGWIINETGYLGDDFVGSLGHVIEREGGRVMRFPTRIPTGRIMTEYDSVVGAARVASPHQQSS
ncbi:hypothetical protein ThrDRAFT_03162 [Frankia casuarinae]|uniref:Uncharacterized protein n=1 Tax=Frankia casuarinae (strain DSM 45818 / CECT 9043 / HFP020203 / CcI3) TaxID=106370 RepID=Q2JC27_FRACC|nr:MULTISPECIES: hypothetical protein [Frankia]ABD11165.1 hypothetical protein Francci3_1789 [Frankia casuarinae]ETA00817.1 hypothetical protein CcI6DRAFT_03758 [Frankia sp. CcI6]EYT91235.1 hypothetical protein ThrDRAFT_03162 [Frankia casuarinae]KFB03371.1 hypothetical protein ALLO2DRAFT_03875 [Frankia sp. Allo2]OAA21487.1 hypothetical protein AAY23_107626 [Frankia casuarinae]